MSDNEANNSGQGLDVAVDRIRPVVADRLRAIERDRQLRVLYACESGSRAWGFASNDSDFDVRFLFVRPADHYLRLRPPKDAFDIHDDSEYDLDLAGWDIRKAAELMRKSNGPLTEWLGSPIVYESNDAITSTMKNLTKIYFDPCKAAHQYLSLANNTYKKYLEGNANPAGKKYFYALRPLACIHFIKRHNTPAPTAFEGVLAGIDLPDDVRDAIDKLLTAKRAGTEMNPIAADPILHAWLESAMIECESIAPTLPTNDTPNTPLDRFISDIILTEKNLP